MSTLDGMPLLDAAGAPTSGAAFLLNVPSKIDAVVDCPSGWQAQVSAGGKYIVSRAPVVVGDYATSRDTAFQAAQHALDLLSIARGMDTGIRDFETEHLAWWHEAAGPVLRTVHVTTLNMKLSASPVAIGPDGKPKPAAPSPPITWHESLRYFRLSQTTDDLFDSYRNLYLALEAILDKMSPQAVKASGKPAENEGQWFQRALSEAHAKIGLSAYAPKGSLNPVDDLFKELYVDTRTALFHAKTSRPSLLPHAGGPGQQTVAAVVERLGTLFIKLAETALGTRSGSSMVTIGGFDLMTEKLKTALRLHATDDPKMGEPDSPVINPTGRLVIDMTTRHAPELEKPYVRAFLGHVTGSEMEKLNQLTGIASKMDDGTLLASGTIEGALKLSKLSRFECQMSVRLRNVQQPRSHFSS